MLTARAITSPKMTRELTACTVMAALAHRASGITSVGLNAVALAIPAASATSTATRATDSGRLTAAAGPVGGHDARQQHGGDRRDHPARAQAEPRGKQQRDAQHQDQRTGQRPA
jgi:hypothetical protein